MVERKSQENILGLLKRVELLANEYYKTCAEKFPAEKAFWSGLALEELIHADWIGKLNNKVCSGQVFLGEGRFEAQAVLNAIAEIENHLRDLKEKSLSLEEAIDAALKIENSLTEKSFFKVYESDSDEIKDILRALEEAYNLHKERVEEKKNKL